MSEDATPPLLPEALTRPVLRVWQRVVALSRPMRVLLASTVVAAVLLSGWLTWRSNVETWGVLFSQLERDDAAALVNKLKELKVPYRIRDEGAIIEVPEAQVHELRLELASAGLPRGGGVGFESFDHMRLGATEFEQRVMFRRALEGELARSVGTLGAVQSARVHLVMPERSVFVSRSDPASASVVLRLRPGRRLGSSEISGVVHLVASAVPSLTAARITLVTTDGEMLHRARTGGGDGSTDAPDEEQGAQHRAMESALEERTRAMLERVVGEGHADVRASVEMDLARVEHTEDHYDRARVALRSEEQTLEQTAPPGGITLAGVPGAESNLGSAPTSVTGGPDGGVLREQHTRNFEVDHVSDRRVATQGAIKRITVAVVVDGVARTDHGRVTITARDPEEITRLTALVRGAVGASDDRGDVVTVESIPFRETVETANPAAARPTAVAHAMRWTRGRIAGAVGVGLLVLVVAALALRRRPRPEFAALNPLLGEAAPEEAPQLTTESERENLRLEAHARAAADPATAALVLRYWLGADDPDRSKV